MKFLTLTALIPSLCGCGGAIFSTTSANNPPFQEGIYSGSGSCTLSIIAGGQAFSDTTANLPFQMIISSSGLPVFDGVEASRGSTRTFTVGDFTATDTFTQVVVDSESILLDSDARSSGTVEGIDISLRGSTRYFIERTAGGTMAVSLDTFVQDVIEGAGLLALGYDCGFELEN